MAKMLLQKGANADAADNTGETPLDKAIVRGHEIMAKAVLERSNRVNLSVDSEQSHGQAKSLFIAIARGYSGIAQLLLDHGFDVNARDNHCRAPLHLAAGKGHLGVVTVLLGHQDIDINAQDQYEATALHLAAKQGYTTIVKELLAMPETDTNRQDKSGATALWLATRHGHEALAIQLLSQPDIDVNAIVHLNLLGLDRSTSLHHAVHRSSMPVLKSLVWTRQLDPNITDHQNRTALSWAVERGDLAIIDLLLTRPDIRVDPTGIHEDPILWLAIKNGRVDVVRKLLRYPKVDLNYVDTSRRCYSPSGRAMRKSQSCFLPRVRD
ncbi:ankyrin repeat-containing domain protein [Aspergillus oleicola]